jgi:hypothetical protein
MSSTLDNLSGASQLAIRLADRSIPGGSKDPGDYRPAWIKLSGPEFNPADPNYRPELDPLGFLVGHRPVDAEGEPVIYLGGLSGWEERDRVVIDGKETRPRVAIYKRQPEVTPVKGKGGGLKTDRGWITGRFDEIFLLAGRELSVLALYDMHHVITEINRQASLLGVGAMYEIKWQLAKKMVSDGQYSHAEPVFTSLGVIGEARGPSEAEIAQAKKLTVLVGQLSYQNPDIPLRLVVGGPPAPSRLDDPPPPSNEDGDGPNPHDDSDIPDWIKDR